MSTELITIEQLPIITERLAVLSEEIEARISDALALECTEDTAKTVKAVRAGLTKQFTELDERRKAVKAAIMAPYERFESAFRQYISEPFRRGDAELKSKINAVENGLKSRKREDVKTYFDEYSLSRGIDFVNMDTWNPNITLTATLTALKKDAKDYIDRICEDLALIETQEHKTEIHVEYQRSLNVSQAIAAVTERHRAIEAQTARQNEQESRRAAEAETVKRMGATASVPLAPPTVTLVEDDPVRTVVFKVTAPLSKLREMKKFLVVNGYEFE